MFQDPQTRQMNQPKMFRKKILFRRIIPPFFFESSESDRFFNYLHDSNSIFWAQGIKSELFFGRTVSVKGQIVVKTCQSGNLTYIKYQDIEAEVEGQVENDNQKTHRNDCEQS